ncbi:phenylalanine--tRNA ligase subunit beta [bacterium]|nr:phenylalanine--tRNA ligase subunit beta [bacterium]
MKLSTNWLREYININYALDELATKLTMAGLEVEETIPLSKEAIAKAGGSGTSDDVVWDVKVTPNRGDWLSVLGVARECAPLVGANAKMPATDVKGSEPPTSEYIKIRIDDPDLCRRYVGIVVRGVEIKESPGWLKDRLIAAGMRPINNVVDVTNYVMLELGQPLHAFDYKLLHDSQIIVRRAKPGEVIVSLDGQERKLEEDMLVIADSDRAVALAGIMGGIDSEISEQTQDILIESANFNSTSIRRTSKHLGLVTESSYRYERSVDPSIAPIAAMRAAQLIGELGNGTVSKGMVDIYPSRVEPLEITARPKRVNDILGTDIDASSMVDYLNSLEIEASLQDGLLICRVPTFRVDITREIDIVEEVGRVYGYESFAATLPKSSLQGKDSPEGLFRDRVRRILMTCGCQEALTHSLVSSSLTAMTGKSDISLGVRNPLTEDLDAMRTDLFPNLLQVIARNQSYGTNDVSVFEVGKVYFKTQNADHGERLSIAGAMIGNMATSAWSLPEEALQVDFYTCKAIVENLLDGLGIEKAEYKAAEVPMLHATRAAKIIIEDNEVGILGEVAPDVRESFDLRGRPYVFELDFNALIAASPKIIKYKEPARFPALYRHLAVVVDDKVEYTKLERLVQGSGKGLVADVDLLDVYKGEQIGLGRRSLTISIVFRSQEKTLTDDEVNSVLTGIKEVLTGELGASFR